MNYYFLILLFVAPIRAMDILPPVRTPEELHADAVKAAIAGTIVPFVLTLPVSMASHLVLKLPPSIYCAATVAALIGSYRYYEERYPTDEHIKWKHLVKIRPQIISTILDTDRELNKKPPFLPSKANYELYGLPSYRKLAPHNNVITDRLLMLSALCEGYSEHEVPASALALHLQKRKRTLEECKRAMINFAPYSFDLSEDNQLPDLYSPPPETSLMDRLALGDPESPTGMLISKRTMKSCLKTLGKLESCISDLHIAMGE